MALIIASATSEVWMRNFRPLASLGTSSGLLAENCFMPDSQ